MRCQVHTVPDAHRSRLARCKWVRLETLTVDQAFSRGSHVYICLDIWLLRLAGGWGGGGLGGDRRLAAAAGTFQAQHNSSTPWGTRQFSLFVMGYFIAKALSLRGSGLEMAS